MEERICEKDTVRRERAKRERNGHRWSQHHCNIFILIFKSIQIFKLKISSNRCALTYLRSKNLFVNYPYLSKYDPIIAYSWNHLQHMGPPWCAREEVESRQWWGCGLNLKSFKLLLKLWNYCQHLSLITFSLSLSSLYTESSIKQHLAIWIETKLSSLRC